MAGPSTAQRKYDTSNGSSLGTAPEPGHSTSNALSSSVHSDLAVAVIGMACKLPGADSLEQFWNILETGSSQCRELPNDRFPDWRFERRAYPKNFKCNVINDVDAFDHKFFKIASREATFMDPQQRLALQVTYQALESAGYFNRDVSERERDMGCYIATCMNEYHENVAYHPPSAFSLTGSIRPFIAGKISHYFGWTGPAMIFDAACAASGTAIHQACRAVVSGDCSSAIAGATNIFVSPDTFQNLAAGHFISPTGASKSFDATADGYCRGEGVAVIVLKKLSDALRDGDGIKGVLAATAIGQGADETSITVPHGPTQANLYRKALRLAGLKAHDISYVEAHGTGTPVGDPIEAESIRQVFGNRSSHSPHGTTYLGSHKSNIGHTEAASGLSALIKVLLMMQKGIIPQQALFNNLNPAIAPFESDGMAIPRSNVPWTAKFKAACVNNYGASANNAVMIVTQPPDGVSPPQDMSVTSCPVTINASSPSSLIAYCSSLLSFIHQSSQADLFPDICYHLSGMKNLDLPHSVCATVSSQQELNNLLTSTVAGQHQIAQTKARPAILLFGGQTGKTACVPQSFYDSSEIFRHHLNECDQTLQSLGCPSIFPAIFESRKTNDTTLLHSMLFSGQFASAMTWLDCGLRPARLIGHSFGQITALCVSGVLSLYDSLRLVTGRARLIMELWGKDTGAMIAIEADVERVTDLLNQHGDLKLEIACYNGPQSVVAAGDSASVDAFEILLKSLAKPVRWKRLQITHAFHSALTEPLLRPLQDLAEQLNFQSAKIPFEACSKHGTWELVTPTLVASQTRQPVYFHRAVERISEQLGHCTWLEAGFGSSAPMLRRALGEEAPYHDIKSVKLDSASSLKPLADITVELWKLGLPTQFWPFHHRQRHQYRVLNLPPYQFDQSRHWLDWKGASTPVSEGRNPLPEHSPLLLLVRKTQRGGEFHVNTTCDSWQTICSTHQILGTPICPLSSLLGLVSEAIDTIRNGAAQKIGIYDIQDLTLPNSISEEIEGGLSLTITNANNPHSWTFMVSHISKLGQEYASGTLSAKKNSAGEFARLQRLVSTTHMKGISNNIEADSVKGKAVYRSLADLLQFPKSRQVVKEVSAKDDEAVGYLVSQSGDAFTALENISQVPLLCLNSLHDREDNTLYVKTAMRQTKFSNSLRLSSDQDMAWNVYVKFFEVGSQEATCDIFAFDAQSERLSIIMLDVTFTKLQISPLSKTTGDCLSLPAPNVSHQPTSLDPLEQISRYVSQAPALDLSIKEHARPQSHNLPDLAEALSDLLIRVADVEPGTLSQEAMIADLGIDSLMGMEVAEEINTTFSITIGTAEFATATSVGSLCELIAKQATGFYYNSEPESCPRLDSLVTTGSGDKTSTSHTSDTEFSDDDKGFVTSYHSLSRPTSTEESLRAVLKAFDIIRQDFDIFAKERGCDQFWSRVYPHQTKLIVAYITEALAKLGCDLAAVKAGEKIPNIAHSPEREKLSNQLLRVLHDDGLVTPSNSDWIRTSKPVSVRPLASARFEQIQADFPHFALEHRLLHVAGSKLDECLSGKLDSLSLLFGSPEKRQLMADQYLKAPIQSSVSEQLVRFIKQCFSSETRHRTLQVLEIGGGTCGTSIPAVNAFAQLEIPVEYTFTDISSSFITAAKAKLGEHGFVEFRTLDITEEPSPDLQGRFDMIIATNVIHATPNACTSAQNARQMLRPGGFLTLVEYTRKLDFLDVIFGQLDGWWLFEDGRDHATMDVAGWKSTLHRAGFGTIDWTGGQNPESEILRIILAC